MDTTSPRIKSGGRGRPDASGDAASPRIIGPIPGLQTLGMILAVLLDGDGRPVCTEMWPGNTADVNSLIPAVDRLQRRFRINRVCVVADRGMISAETIAELETRGLIYVLGVRERTGSSCANSFSTTGTRWRGMPAATRPRRPRQGSGGRM